MALSIRVVAMGGTIAGIEPQGAEAGRYRAAQLGIEQLLAPVLERLSGKVGAIEAVQLAQVDSRDMSHGLWQKLAAQLQAGQDDPSVLGQVVTHGTDTMEETAVFLDCVLSGHKPVVLTAAMRPANSVLADGPANLAQALELAADPRAQGILMAMGGQTWAAVQARKVHPFALQAFSPGDGQAVACWSGEGWNWQPVAHEPPGFVGAKAAMPDSVDDWPRVEIIHSHAGAQRSLIQSVLAARDGDPPVRGLVISATGNGSLHHALHEALLDAVRLGRIGRQDVLVATRCTGGWIVGEPEHGWPVTARMTPAQARVALMVQIARRPRAAGQSA